MFCSPYKLANFPFLDEIVRSDGFFISSSIRDMFDVHAEPWTILFSMTPATEAARTEPMAPASEGKADGEWVNVFG